MFNLIYLAIVFPLLGLLTNAIFGKFLGERWVGIVGSTASGLAFGVSVLMAVALAGNHGETVIVPLSTWLQVGTLDIPWAFQVDTLSVTMMLLVTGVGTLIHIYAIGYMHGDERFTRFFVFLNFFIVAMLLLVTGSSYLMLFIGWEGVGLASFLLIGFWFDQGKDGIGNANAGQKAFVVNRIGDFGVLLAMFLLFWTTGSLTFGDVFHYVHEHHEAVSGVITVVTLLMLLGVAGKSAQIPLYVWLPDAMAGPTPVSALIHAATMVTAGVYLVARSAPLFHEAEVSSMIVTLVGTVTALWAGSIALAQYDIKKVLAYSTVSQLGFMVAAVGLGAYLAGMFHLLTHAFFKGLLFLSAGSVIHGMEHGHHHLAHDGHAGGGGDSHDGFDPQDMRTMGGLRDKMPVTFWVYLIGSLALAGVFPFAGFWSKDEILADAWLVGFDKGNWHGVVAYVLLAIAATFTAFYMGRQIFMVFFGKPRHAAARHAAESSPVMTVPLIILAVLAALGGLMNLPGEILGIHLPLPHVLGDWLAHTHEYFHVIDFNITVALMSTALALGAIGVAWLVYGRKPQEHATDADPLSRVLGPLWVFLENKGLVDELYDLIIIRPFKWLASFLADVIDWQFWHDFFHDRVLAESFDLSAKFLAEPIDRGIVDRFFNGLAEGARALGSRLRQTQTGYIRTYAVTILLGTVALISYFLVVRLGG